jgi:hypothetical protein
MPTHKMLTINGIRVRPEDAHRYRQTPDPEPAPAAPAADGSAAVPADPFDPSAATAEQVLTYLGTVGAAEAARVLDAEAAGKNRVGITSKRAPLLAAAADRDEDGGEGGGDGGPAT